jgi:uridine kinase
MWTLSVYLRVSPEETLRRAKVRDLDLFGSHDEIERRYRRRYLPG